VCSVNAQGDGHLLLGRYQPLDGYGIKPGHEGLAGVFEHAGEFAATLHYAAVFAGEAIRQFKVWLGGPHDIADDYLCGGAGKAKPAGAAADGHEEAGLYQCLGDFAEMVGRDAERPRDLSDLAGRPGGVPATGAGLKGQVHQQPQAVIGVAG